MDHPFFYNIRNLIFYTAIWISISIIHFAVLFYFYNIDFSPALTDSLFFNLTFGLMGTSVWYIVKYGKPAKSVVFNRLINHITALTIILILWIGTGTSLLKVLFYNNDIYIHFLDKSIAWRSISGLLFYSILVLIYYIFIYYNDQMERSGREAKLNELLRSTELNLLKSQINPHFLFNALNSISSLTISNREKPRK